jgi:hypothetical protein
MPLLHVDVRHGDGSQITRFSIFEGDDIAKKVANFGEIF